MKVLSRNHLKIIGCVSMVVDHVGVVFFPHIELFRVVGRLAFPLFAFFIAEGMYYSKNRKKYMLTMLAFALISQIPHMLVLDFRPNILFTFLIAMLIITFYDGTKTQNENKINSYIYFISAIFITLIFSLLGLISYGLWGVLLVFFLYVFKNSPVYKWAVVSVCLIMLSISFHQPLLQSLTSIQMFGLLVMPLLLFYNGKAGKYNYKYAFYIFYPAHLMLLYVISLLI